MTLTSMVGVSSPQECQALPAGPCLASSAHHGCPHSSAGKDPAHLLTPSRKGGAAGSLPVCPGLAMTSVNSMHTFKGIEEEKS